MLTVVTWKWKPAATYRSQFNAEHVNIARRMVARHYNKPHEFVCVTDDPVGIDPEVRIVPLWDDFASMKSLHGDFQPCCYRRLRAFSNGAADVFGDRFVSIDLDFIALDDLVPLWDRPEPFIMWKPDPHPLQRSARIKTFYNGSMFMMTAGARRKVWRDFNPATSPAAAKAAGFFGSDQAWISLCLGPNEATWTHRDGAWSYRNQINPPPRSGKLPEGARIVFFHGRVDPWSPEAQALPWVRDNYR